VRTQSTTPSGEQLLWDLADEMDPEDGCLWIHGTEDAVWNQEKTASLLYPVGRDGEWEDMAETIRMLGARETQTVRACRYPSASSEALGQVPLHLKPWAKSPEEAAWALMQRIMGLVCEHKVPPFGGTCLEFGGVWVESA
jgi:hypothetical protein